MIIIRKQLSLGIKLKFLINKIKNLTMPENRQVCTYCGGCGWYQEIGEEACGSCAGTGRDTTSDLWSDYCKTCNGSGRVPYTRRVTCSSCGGSGYQ